MSSRFSIPVIGLTGGVASGKSSVARIFREKAGIPVIDADQIARELSQPGGLAASEIQARFGTLDRAKLRQKIFSNPQLRRELESILHPLIAAESQKRIEEFARAGARYAIYEAALLVETGRHRELDGLIVVEAPLESRIARLMERDSVTRELALSMIQSQASDLQREKAASLLLQNDGTFDELEAQVTPNLLDAALARSSGESSGESS
ncbi:MAG: dephospho-CoA kinase [Oligoflexia bacterium]